MKSIENMTPAEKAIEALELQSQLNALETIVAEKRARLRDLFGTTESTLDYESTWVDADGSLTPYGIDLRLAYLPVSACSYDLPV